MQQQVENSWIVTLDVLKYQKRNRRKYGRMLNSNIRCIEMSTAMASEIASTGWIVTLDVLKYLLYTRRRRLQVCWIVTLDVLK